MLLSFWLIVSVVCGTNYHVKEDHQPNSTIQLLPSDVILSCLFPCLSNKALFKLMNPGLNQKYRDLSHQHLTQQRKGFWHWKLRWKILFQFIEGMTEFQWQKTSQGLPLMKLIMIPLARNRKQSVLLKIAENVLFTILQHQQLNETIKADIVQCLLDNLDLNYYLFHNCCVCPTHTLKAMVSLMDIEFERNIIKMRHQDAIYNFHKYQFALTQIFESAQKEYKRTKDRYNRYSQFGMYHVDIFRKHMSEQWRLWQVVQPEFIPEFLNLSIPTTSKHLMLGVIADIIDAEFIGCYDGRYYNLFIQHKDKLFDMYERGILSRALLSDYYSFDSMVKFMQFVMDHHLMNKSFILEVLNDTEQFMSMYTRGGAVCLERRQKCISYLSPNSNVTANVEKNKISQVKEVRVVSTNDSTVENMYKSSQTSHRVITTDIKIKRKRNVSISTHKRGKNSVVPQTRFNAWNDEKKINRTNHDCCSTQ